VNRAWHHPAVDWRHATVRMWGWKPTVRLRSPALSPDSWQASRRPPRPGLQGLFARTAATAPAYAKFLREHGIDAAEAKTERDFRRLPMTGKDSLREQIRASLRSS